MLEYDSINFNRYLGDSTKKEQEKAFIYFSHQ